MKNAIHIHIYICETHFSSAVLGLRIVGGVKCKPFQKHSIHWKWALKMIFKESGCFQYPEAVVTSTANESLRWFNTSSRCFVGVESACTTVANFCKVKL